MIKAVRFQWPLSTDFMLQMSVAGGNDAGAIHISGTGVRTIAVSVPCRYLHSPSSVIETADLESSYTLVKALAKRIPQL